MKKKDQKVHTDADMKRYVGAIMEEVKDGFKIQKEYSIGIQEKLGKIEKTLDSHSEQIANIMVDISDVRFDMKQMKLDVNLNLKDKIDKRHFVDMEGRVRKLEKA